MICSWTARSSSLDRNVRLEIDLQLLRSSGSSEAFLRTGVTEAGFWDAEKTSSLINALNSAEINGDNSTAAQIVIMLFIATWHNL